MPSKQKLYIASWPTKNTWMWLCCRAPRPQDEISGAQGKLIRLIEDQLSQGEVPLDLERLRNQFTLADRLHRDSLSHGEVCHQFDGYLSQPGYVNFLIQLFPNQKSFMHEIICSCSLDSVDLKPIQILGCSV